MILEQHYLACLAQASYFLADPEAGVAAVVDPRRDVGVYLERARELGCEIRHVFLTHFHADFVAGHLELEHETGAELHLGARAEAEFPFTPMREGGEVRLGSARVRFLETPGHTPESCCLLVYEDERAQAPRAVLTGDTLFVGDVGRPDLMVSQGLTAEELAASLYDSTRRLLDLPDATEVLPGHGPGSACGKSLGPDTTSTIGRERETNHALQPMDRETFVARVTDALSTPPAYFAFDADLNRRARGTLGEAVRRGLAPLDLETCLARADAGAVLLDTRDADAYAAGHLAGSVNVGLEGKFATWVGTVLAPETEIVVVAEPGREEEAVTRLGRIGYDRVLGHLAGGPGAFAARPDRVRRFERVRAEELAAELAGPAPPAVLDVRTPAEREGSRIEGSVHVPLAELERRLGEVPAGGPLVVTCAGGYRSAIAVSLLGRRGRADTRDLTGGMTAWNAAGVVAS